MKKLRGIVGIIIAILICILTINVLNIDFYKKDSPNSLQVMNGYQSKIEIKGLKNPSTMCFDEVGNLYIGENTKEGGRVSIYKPNGEIKEVVKGLNSPIGYLLINKGTLYISHKGKISKFSGGKLVDIINNLPSFGDYQNAGIAIGSDNMLYIAQPSATNSGVVGLDNYENGWLRDNPHLHDIPFSEMILKGNNFVTKNPFTEDKNDVAYTNGFMPFNTKGKVNDIVKPNTVSNATILRANLDGSFIETFAIGVRNPRNIIPMKDGTILVGVQGMENRGSRPVAGGGDYIYRIDHGDYAGWPDYEGGVEISSNKFKPDGKNQPQSLTYSVKPEVVKPLIKFEGSGKIGYMDLSKDEDFGFKGQLIIPFKKGEKDDAKIIAYNPKDNSSQEIVVNRGGEKTLVSPSQCLFSPAGNLYILDSGSGIIVKVTKNTPEEKGILPKNVPIEYVIISGAVILTLVIFLFIKFTRGKKTKQNK
ncbi:MAG: hypothetical protein RSB66_01945 [Clostridium sp.]